MFVGGAFWSVHSDSINGWNSYDQACLRHDVSVFAGVRALWDFHFGSFNSQIRFVRNFILWNYHCCSNHSSRNSQLAGVFFAMLDFKSADCLIALTLMTVFDSIFQIYSIFTQMTDPLELLGGSTTTVNLSFYVIIL